MSMNSMRIQFVQNLHKLQMMERHISTNFIPFNEQIFDEDYFDHLISEIQEIRASERRFYQKITDIYATSVDYDKDSNEGSEAEADEIKKLKSTLKLNVYQKMSELNEIVTMYLDYASRQARRHIPMTMNDWKTKLDAFLMFNDADLLQNKGTVTAAIAKQFAESEFEKYRIIQDNLYKSDFDRLILEEEDGKTIRFFEVAKNLFQTRDH